MEARVEQVLRRREMPCLTVLDQDYRIVSTDARLGRFCESIGCPQPQSDRLPSDLEQALREMTGNLETLLVWKSRVVLRASRLNQFPGRCLVVALERMRTRAPLDEAAQRFSLSRREIEVLECIMCGLRAGGIAERLHISKSTVGEYFKHLAAKIGAHNHAEMIARVFDWRAE